MDSKSYLDVKPSTSTFVGRPNVYVKCETDSGQDECWSVKDEIKSEAGSQCLTFAIKEEVNEDGDKKEDEELLRAIQEQMKQELNGSEVRIERKSEI